MSSPGQPEEQSGKQSEVEPEASPERGERPVDEEDTQKPVEPEWRRRQRLARIFGDVLPTTTCDERDADGSGRSAQTRGEAWLKSQVPPHHGG